MELEMDCLTSRRLLQKICNKCQFCTKAWASLKAALSSSYMMDGQNVKKKYPMGQIPIKMLKQHSTLNSSWRNLKIYSSKWCRKTSQRWIYVGRYLANLVNTTVLNIRIFSRRYHFSLKVFSTSEYIYYWQWQVLPNVLQSKWC